MIVIKFPDTATQDEGVGFLAMHTSGRLLKTGEVIVADEALAMLANENIPFTVIGKATYEQMAAFRGDVAAQV